MRGRRPGLSAVLVLVPLAVLAGCAQRTALVPKPDVPVRVGASSAAVAPTAQLVARPNAGRAGDEVRLSGEGYPAGARVVFTLHGRRVGDATTDAAGRFAGAPVVVPDSFRDAEPGAQFVFGATSGPFYAETPFVLTR
ncbi:hypothetical protein [Saccharothrix australiensis]|uniref:Uncharacterized protein n=1 Tax=Saccharothrix australiensis TaxID=2072 RepID=A0A495W6B4_9PSEU|nr:hypothetical protein [Saccharothrix australiensis]RKT57261.1 hypothetical protein C8E97_5979 [Saccharothrix australiensis]